METGNIVFPLYFIIILQLILTYKLLFFRSIFDKSRACDKMFRKISTAAYDPNCFDTGEEDFLRSVPCPKDQVIEFFKYFSF